MLILPALLSERKDSSEICVIELYRLKLRTGTVYIAACDEDIEFMNQTFISIPIQRETINKSVDNVVDSTSLKIADVDYAKLAYILNGFDFRGCDVEIVQVLYPECLKDPSLCRWVYTGYIDSPSYEAGVFSCTLKARFPNIEVPNRSCQLFCNAEFGDPDDCGMSKDIRVITIATGSNQGEIFYGDNDMNHHWDDGVITIGGESRMIRESTDKIYLAYPFIQDIYVGETATIERGCDKTQKTCRERFNNTINFSGFPSIPWESVYR